MKLRLRVEFSCDARDLTLGVGDGCVFDTRAGGLLMHAVTLCGVGLDTYQLTTNCQPVYHRLQVAPARINDTRVVAGDVK